MTLSLKHLLLTGAAAAMLTAPALADKANDTLNVAFSLEPEPLDTYKIAGREGLILARHVYDGLIYKDMITGKFEGLLAESWTRPDPLTIEFKLRKDVNFQNGAHFTADDVVDTLNTVIKPEYGTRYAISVDWIKSAEKIDDYTVRIHMAKPFAGAFEMLAGSLPIYTHEYFDKVGSAGMAKAPIGTGPYKVVSQEPGVKYVLERWDGIFPESPKAGAKIKTIVVRTMPELNTQYTELMAGKLDWMWRIPPDQAAKLTSRVQVISAPIMRISFINLAPVSALGDTPLKDVRVRKAISYAINRDAITKAFAGGASQTLKAFCNPAQFGCTDDVTQYPYDPEKAKELLAEAGFKDGVTLPMTFAAMPRPVAEAIAADLAKVSIKVQLDELQYAAGVTKWRDEQVPAFFSNWGSYGVGDAAFLLSNFFGGGADDLVKDPELTEWLNEADTATDPDLRKADYAKALKKIADEALIVPMYSFNVNYGMSKDLNYTPYPDEFARFWQSSWK